MNEAAANSAPESTQENGAQEEDLEASLVQLASKLFPKEEVQKNMRFMEDMEARVSEMEARLAMAEEAKLVAIKERDAADEARKKLEKTLSELLSKFAGVRESQAALLREAEQTRAGYESQILKLQESEQKAAELAGCDASLRQQNDELRQQNEELREQNDALREKLESQFLNLEVLQTQLRGEQREREAFSAEIIRLKAHAHGEIKPALAENNRFSREMVTHVEDVVEQLRALRDEVTQRCNQMENVSNYLGSQITETHEKLIQRLNTQPEQAEPDDLPPARPIDSTPMLQAQPA